MKWNKAISFALLLILAIALCTLGCYKPAPTEPASQDAAKPTEQEAEVTAEPEPTAEPGPTAEPDGQAAKETEQAEKATEEPSATAEPAIPEPTEMTWAEYNQYCLDLLHGIQREAVISDTLRKASEIYFRFYEGTVTVYESAGYDMSKGWSFSGLIRTLPAEPFTPPEGFDTMHWMEWYWTPDKYQNDPMAYRGYLGEDWATVISESSAGNDFSIMIFTDDGWQSAGMAEGLSGFHKTCGGRCGSRLFAGADSNAVSSDPHIIAFFTTTTDDGEWHEADLPMPEYDRMFPQPLTPVFDGERGILPILTGDLLTGDPQVLFYITEDGGMTWEPMEGLE